MTPSLQPGDPFPDLELPDHAGNARRLSELVAGDPTVLHFYRGWWCPKEQRYRRLRAMGAPWAVGDHRALADAELAREGLTRS